MTHGQPTNGFIKSLRKLARWAGENFHAAVALSIFLPLLCYIIYLTSWHLHDYWKQDTFKLLLDSLGLPAAATFIIVIYTAFMAERINRSLIETQTIAAGPASDFSSLFKRHLMMFLDGTSDELRKVDLVLSTPAFGLHPLGAEKCEEFIDALSHVDCPADIVLYSPDAHFHHFINTLLWQEYGVSNGLKRTNLSELAFYTDQFFIVVSNNSKHGWHVWPTNKSDLRLFHFEMASSSRLYLVLSDDVGISSDLREFRGRSMPLPHVLREAVVGEEDSLFMKYRHCPILGHKGDDTALSNDKRGVNEFGLLLADYLLGRTSQVVFTYETFQNEITNLLAKQEISGANQISSLTNVVFAYLDYLRDIVGGKAMNAKGTVHTPAMTISDAETNRIKALIDLRPAGTVITSGDYVTMLNKLCKIVPEISGELWLQKDPINRSTEGMESQQLIALLYLIARSGMGQSEFVSNRVSKSP
jgi:hypothetical protein